MGRRDTSCQFCLLLSLILIYNNPWSRYLTIESLFLFGESLELDSWNVRGQDVSGCLVLALDSRPQILVVDHGHVADLPLVVPMQCIYVSW